MRHLREEIGLGPHTVYLDEEQRLLDQNILMVEILKYRHFQNITYVFSPTEALCVLQSKTREERKHITVVITYHDSSKFQPSYQNYTFDILAHQCAAFMPLRDEVLWEEAKVHDLQILDEVAAELGAWRPITCYLGNKGGCPLKTKRWSVLKRSNSSSGNHVIIVSPGLRSSASRKGKPTCDAGVRAALVRLEKKGLEDYGELVEDRSIEDRKEDDENCQVNKDNSGSKRRHRKKVMIPEEKERKERAANSVGGRNCYQWIHQEFVENLRFEGEFRVFVATKTAEYGTREPYITHMIHTTLHEKTCVIQVGSGLLSSDVTDQYFEKSKLTQEDLRSFVLRTYKALQAKKLVGLDSLRIGARLDIAWHPKKEDFFVNEITRWYNADTFPEMLDAENKDVIVKAWASSFAECFPVRPTPTPTPETLLQENIARSETALARTCQRTTTSIAEEQDPGDLPALQSSQVKVSCKRKAKKVKEREAANSAFLAHTRAEKKRKILRDIKSDNYKDPTPRVAAQKSKKTTMKRELDALNITGLVIDRKRM
ncbi:hypothetical protein N0V90_009660 [Kalmusia sp. IMI 367209]|nr:hypothetical protein N0V90_009660 [Kalmusia sp. IMI 367209]